MPTYSLILRGEISRKITVEELDGNFLYLESISGGGSASTGPQGDQGPQGFGSQGPQGDQGPQGFGSQGPQGDFGSQGPQGFTGDTGDVGSQGDQGPQGDIGPQGDVGSMGDQGSQGDIGPQGDVGPQGGISGTYSPINYGTTNLTSATLSTATYMQIGNVVSVFGALDTLNTGTGATDITISIPVTSTFSTINNANGSATGYSSIQPTLSYIDAIPSNPAVKIIWISSPAILNIHWKYSFQYLVI